MDKNFYITTPIYYPSADLIWVMLIRYTDVLLDLKDGFKVNFNRDTNMVLRSKEG